jgi:hypothetical protein
VLRYLKLLVYLKRNPTSIPAWGYAATVEIVTPAHCVALPAVYGTARSIVERIWSLH